MARLKKQLEKAVSDANTDHALDLLRALDRTHVNVDTLGVRYPPQQHLPFDVPFPLRMDEMVVDYISRIYKLV